MKEYLKKVFSDLRFAKGFGKARNPKIKKIFGVILVLIGFIALVTPFTPGATWLIFVGLELLGFHFLLWDKIKARLRK